MNIFEDDHINNLWRSATDHVLEYGDEIETRGFQTRELINVCLKLTNPLNNLMTIKIRNLNPWFALGELFWILRGSNDVAEIEYYNKAWKDFSDNGKILHGAYGKRICDMKCANHSQFMQCYTKLDNDQHCRQAVMTIYNGDKDFNIKTKDIPCTVMLHFLIRHDRLYLTTYMRSQDLLLGTPYDVFNFTMLQRIMAELLGVKLGYYQHILGSYHVYKKDIEFVESIINSSSDIRVLKEKGLTKIKDDDNQHDLPFFSERLGLVKNKCRKEINTQNIFTNMLNAINVIESHFREQVENPTHDDILELDGLNNDFYSQMYIMFGLLAVKKRKLPIEEFVFDYVKDECLSKHINWKKQKGYFNVI